MNISIGEKMVLQALVERPTATLMSAMKSRGVHPVNADRLVTLGLVARQEMSCDQHGRSMCDGVMNRKQVVEHFTATANGRAVLNGVIGITLDLNADASEFTETIPNVAEWIGQQEDQIKATRLNKVHAFLREAYLSAERSRDFVQRNFVTDVLFVIETGKRRDQDEETFFEFAEHLYEEAQAALLAEHEEGFTKRS